MNYHSDEEPDNQIVSFDPALIPERICVQTAVYYPQLPADIYLRLDSLAIVCIPSRLAESYRVVSGILLWS